MSRASRRTTLGLLATLAALVPVSMAWACVAPVSIITTNPTVQPGGILHIIGRETAPGAPIDIRLNSPTGQVLTTVTGQVGGMTAKWEWDVPIPANIPYGKHTLYAVQNYRNMNAVVPKTVFYVGTVPDPAPTPDARAVSMDVGSGPSGTTLVLLGLAAAVGGLLLVGGLMALAGTRRAEPPQAERVKTK